MTAGACATAHRPAAKPTPTPTLAGGSPAAGLPTAGADPTRIDPASFVRTVDNPWFPLVPGQSRVYEGVRDGKAAHEVFMVTAETKTILGVPCVVVRDSLTLDGHPAEQTDDWYTQDRAGKGLGRNNLGVRDFARMILECPLKRLSPANSARSGRT